MAKYLQEDEGPIAEMNVVPLVDIVLVVLIIFMVSAPIIMKPAMPIELPKGKSGETIRDKNLAILISAEGSVYVDGQLISDEALQDLVKVKLAQNPDLMVLISADRTSQHGVVVKIMDAIKSLGVKKFGISVDPQTPF